MSLTPGARLGPYEIIVVVTPRLGADAPLPVAGV
jgi:hypothetical protein